MNYSFGGGLLAFGLKYLLFDCKSTLFIVIAFSFLLMSPVGADPTNSPGEAGEGVFGESTKGHGEPNSMTGAMNWNYPFTLPTARGGPQPRLSLNYNSFSRVREAGYGWGLNLPVIERSPLSGNPCFTPAGRPIACGEQRRDASGLVSEERYAYNGQPLVMICKLPGSQGVNDPDCGNEIQPEWVSDGEWRYFRLQVEGEFSRFYLSPNRKYWLVQLKGGELLEFGEPPNRPSSGIEHIRANNNAIFRWRLVRHSDARHKVSGAPVNYIDYRWKKLGKRGLLYLTDIYDTPGLNPSKGDANFAHHTQLDWEFPDYPQTSYADIHRAKPDLRLSHVSIASMNWSGMGLREVIRTYYLSYAPKQGATTTVELDQVFTLWNHSFLTEIQVEGRTKRLEDENGTIPLGLTCLCSNNDENDNSCCTSRLPSTKFEYQEGHIGFGIAAGSQILGVPEGDIGKNRSLLPYIKTVGIVDFNQDGLPDIIQSWNAEFCPGEDNDEDAIHESIFLPPYYKPEQPKNTIFCEFMQPWDGLSIPIEQREIQSSRPMIGYANRGRISIFQEFARQCIDAGTYTNPDGLTYYNGGMTPSFFNPSSGTTLVGLGTGGIVAWNLAQWAPYRVRDVLPDSLERLNSGKGCDAGNFEESKFQPSWVWEQLPEIDWAYSDTEYAGDLKHRWYVDIDGDGLVDRFTSTGIRASDFDVAYVEYTRRYGKNYSSTGPGYRPKQIPFATTNYDISSLVPSSEARGETKFSIIDISSLAPSSEARGETKFYYVDINGDGLVDLVTQHPNDNGGIPRVRPGDGYGRFRCIADQQPWPCLEWPAEQSSGYEISVTGTISPWPFTDDTFFHDVTGDGLADIVQYDEASGEVRFWVNQNGQAFACALESCVAGRVQDFGNANYNVGNHRTTFADMDADGIDDIVIITNHGAYVGSIMHKHSRINKDGGAPRPGLLIKIHNGYGATTHVRYRTIQSLDLEAAETSRKWEHHLPVVENVVTQIVTQNSNYGHNLNYPFKRKIQYYYEDPAFDRWNRSFAGFRKVIKRAVEDADASASATTATTYWFGPCQNNRTDVTRPICHEGSDDEDYKSLTGRIVRIDYGDLASFPETWDWGVKSFLSPGHLWTKIFNYSGTSVLFHRNDRRVTYSYPAQIDTYIYDPAHPVIHPDPPAPGILGGDIITDAPHQYGRRKHLSRMVEYDDNGTLKMITEKGVVKDEDSKLDENEDDTVITLFSQVDPFDSVAPALLPCTQDWQCLPNYISVWQPQTDGPSKLLRKSRLNYYPTGNIQSVEGWLQFDALALDRYHAEDKATAPAPDGQLLKRGWHVVATYDYDEWGNVIRTASGHSDEGSSSVCTTITYDVSYKHLPRAVNEFVSGCGGTSLETQIIFDRGFQKISRVVSPNNGSSVFDYDMFGRIANVHLPDPNALPWRSGPILAQQIYYSDKPLLSHIEVRNYSGSSKYTRSIMVYNGLGESVATFQQGDRDNEWIVHDMQKTDGFGQVIKIYNPFLFSGDPFTRILRAQLIPLPRDYSLLKLEYDKFGRPISLSEESYLNKPGENHISFREIVHYKYFPLAIEKRDAEQLKAGGFHEKAFQRIEFDGRGRNTKVVQRIENPFPDNIVTAIQYNPTGEPKSITRSHAGGTYERTMEYDSLGRLMVNKEPNTGNNWRYVWDVAGRLVGTSDARGCGKNIHYDGLGRLLGEDYSPCLSSHAAYTTPDLVTGIGFETFYRYDEYEADQVNPEASFTDDNSKYAVGNLVAVYDRGSYTRFNYDARGQVRRISRKIAEPNGLSAYSSYSPTWFTSRLDYDHSGQLKRRTTGVDIPELLMNGESEERYNYSPRGLPLSIHSSYGAIIWNIEYEPDEKPKSITYGGNSHLTVTEFEYDRWRMLKRHTIARSKQRHNPFNPKPFPKWKLHTHLDYYFTYDEVGNPLVIEDKITDSLSLNLLPPYATPVQKRIMKYDDLYRLTRVDSTYNISGGVAPWISPFKAEINASDRKPVPLQELPTRISQQTFKYDGLGNIAGSTDNLSARYDRSLGTDLVYGTSVNGPNQLHFGDGLKIQYDIAGNMTRLGIERPGNCPTGDVSQCAQWFAYDWDEVGQLARARRWDFDGNRLPPQVSPDAFTSEQPSWDLTYAYSLNKRVRKSMTNASEITLHTLEVFDTLRVQHVPFTDNNYELKLDRVHAYLGGGIAHVFWDNEKQFSPPDTGIRMHMNMSDYLGSSSIVIDHGSSNLIERTTYQPYGAVESDYRPTTFREPYKFTGKEEDIEVGMIYFGARYYQPHLGRFISADPLTIHELGSDLNPYAYVRGRVLSLVDPSGTIECAPGSHPTAGGGACANAEGTTTIIVRTGQPGGGEGPTHPTTPTQPGGGGPTNPTSITPFDPTEGMNFIDRWIVGGTGEFHDAVTSDRNLSAVQTGLAGVSIFAGTAAGIIATGGLALGAAGLSVEGIGAAAAVNFGRAAAVFTEMSLAEQGIVGVGAGGGGMLLNTKYGGHVGPGPFAHPAGRVLAQGSKYASTSEREIIRGLFLKYGCHSCSTKVGPSVADHQMSNRINLKGLVQWFYPQCKSCSSLQGSQVREISRRQHK